MTSSELPKPVLKLTGVPETQETPAANYLQRESAL